MGKSYRYSLLLALNLLFLGGACNRTAKEACTVDLPRLARELGRAELAFRKPTTPGRALASVQEDWRTDWMDWAHGQLMATQTAMDALDEDPSRRSAKKALEGVANGFVEVYALAEAGREDRLAEVLGQLRAQVDELSTRECAAPACRGTDGSPSGCGPSH